MKIRNPTSCRPNDVPQVLLRLRDADERQRAGLHDDGGGGEHQRELVGDQLRGGAQRADQARTCSREDQPAISTPITETLRHGQHEEDADVEVHGEQRGR